MIRLVAWTRGPGRLSVSWPVNAPSGRVTVGHRGTFSSSGESLTSTRLNETEHFIGNLRDCVWTVVEGICKLTMATKNVCEKEGGVCFERKEKGKDKESDKDDGLSMLLAAGFLMTHLP